MIRSRRPARHQLITNLRSGLTWVELAVVLGIIVLLVTFLAPATRNARTASRRVQCKNNLKQMGLALHNYHDVNQSFPPGYILNDDGPYLGWSWEMSISPYCDFNAVLDYPAGLSGNVGSLDSRYVRPVFLCPSDQAKTTTLEHVLIVTSKVVDGAVTTATADSQRQLPRSNYFGVAGYLQPEAGGIDRDFNPAISQSLPLTNRGSLGRFGKSFSTGQRYCDLQNFHGVFGQNSSTRLKDISDGTANTFLVSERYTPELTSADTVGHGTWIGTTDCSTPAGLATVLGDTSFGPNAGSSARRPTTGFGSAHTGGVQMLMADGSVRFVSEKIELSLYRDLSTVDDGRQTGDF